MQQELSKKDTIRNIHSERDLISGLMRYPESLYEIEPFVNEVDFASPVCGKIFSLVKHLVVKEDVKRIDTALLLSKIRDGGLKFDDVNITEWIGKMVEAAKDIQPKTIIALARDIKFFSIRREVYETGSRIQKEMLARHQFGSMSEIIGLADSIYFEAVQGLVCEDEMEELGAGAGEHLHELADHPIDHMGFSSGFKLYDDLIGNLRPDSFNFISARAKVGKSMLGLDMAVNVASTGIPVFYADSEMSRVMVRDRMISHVAQVDIELIETGRWARIPDVCKAVEAAIPIVEKLPITYVSIRAMGADQYISSCRRFLFRKVKRNSLHKWNTCLFVWDYIKLNYYDSEGGGDNWWLNIAKSVVHFKDFLGDTDSAAVVLGQSNREGIVKKNKEGKIITEDSERTVAGSDEIVKTASNVSQLRFKIADEVKKDGEENGDCLLMPYVTRTGRGGAWITLADKSFEREYVCMKRDPKRMTFKEITTNKVLRQKQQDEVRNGKSDTKSENPKPGTGEGSSTGSGN